MRRAPAAALGGPLAASGHTTTPGGDSDDTTTGMQAVILAAMAAVAAVAAVAGMPSYIAVPAEQIAFLDLRALHRPPPALHRPPRQALSPPAQHLPYSQDYPALLQPHHARSATPTEEGAAPAHARLLADSAGAPSKLAERPPDFGEYVDFGAHTGDHGAFGWYADYPVNNHDSSAY